jgi:hypothetical protein
VVHQATGMAAVQLDVTVADALATLRAVAFRSNRSLYEVASDVIDRRIQLGGGINGGRRPRRS